MEITPASISARAGWRAICSRAGMDSSTATKPSSTSSTRMFNQARQVAQGHCASALAAQDCLAQLSAGLLMSGAKDHNVLHPPGSGFIDHVVNKKAEVVRAYLPAGRELPALGDGSLPTQPALRQRRGRGENTRRRSG